LLLYSKLSKKDAKNFNKLNINHTGFKRKRTVSIHSRYKNRKEQVPNQKEVDIDRKARENCKMEWY